MLLARVRVHGQVLTKGSCRLECTDEQMDRIKDACEQREQFREAVFD